MVLQLLPLEEHDLEAYAKISELAFDGEFTNRMYTQGYGQQQRDFFIKRARFKFLRMSDSIRFNKVVDTDLPEDDPCNKIISVAEWCFYATERTEEDIAEQQKMLDELGTMPGADEVMLQAWRSQLSGNRKSAWGGKPHVLLQVLVTHTAHERRGAGSRHLEWGIAAADELGLPLWLEATIAGRPLYERHGFRMVSKIAFDAAAYGVKTPFVIVNMLRSAKDPTKALPNPIKLKLSNVLVLGAGELGEGILKALAAHADVDTCNTRVAVLLRPESKTAAYIRQTFPAFSILSADLATASVESLADIFKLFDGIICCTGFAGGPGTQRKITQAVTIAAASTKADRVRYIPWQFGADYALVGRGGRMELWDEQLDVRDILRGPSSPARLSWTIVSTGIFTSFIFEEAFGVVNGMHGDGLIKVEALGGANNEVTATDVNDIGRIAVQALFDGATTNQIIYTAGQTATYADIAADVKSAFTDRTVELVEKSVPELEDELRRDPDNVFKKYRVVFAEGTGVSWDVSTTYNVRNGIDVGSIGDWLAKNITRVQQRAL